jgi:hypothetical protein
VTIVPYGPIPAMREDRGRFASLRDARVLIYWPHGLGDWIHFGCVAPLLEPANAYAMTRFGDDYVSVMEDNAIVTPLYAGVRRPSDGAELGAVHLGLAVRRCNGNAVTLNVPPALAPAVEAFAPQRLLWTDYPETEGRTAFPYHTKARNLARLLVAPARLASFDLSQPLASSINFTVSEQTQRRVDERLARFVPPRGRLCVISRSGVTAARKNWGDGREARAFVTALARESPAWRFISMEGEELGEGVAAFGALFGDLDEPFARLFKAIANRIDLFVGIPAGPLHLVMARGGIPVVGLWTAHHPDWYDEPNATAIHLIGKYVRDRRFERRLATTSKPASLQHRLHYLDTAQIPAEAVVAAARTVIG